MKLVRWIIVIALALCAGITGAVLAGSFSDAHLPGSAEALHDLVHHDLNLSKVQKVQLAEVEGRFAVRKSELELAIKQANLMLAEAIRTDKANSPRVHAAIERAHEMLGELQKLTIEHVFEMRSILTEEQAGIFDAAVVRALTDD